MKTMEILRNAGKVADLTESFPCADTHDYTYSLLEFIKRISDGYEWAFHPKKRAMVDHDPDDKFYSKGVETAAGFLSTEELFTLMHEQEDRDNILNRMVDIINGAEEISAEEILEKIREDDWGREEGDDFYKPEDYERYKLFYMLGLSSVYDSFRKLWEIEENLGLVTPIQWKMHIAGRMAYSPDIELLLWQIVNETGGPAPEPENFAEYEIVEIEV